MPAPTLNLPQRLPKRQQAIVPTTFNKQPQPSELGLRGCISEAAWLNILKKSSSISTTGNKIAEPSLSKFSTSDQNESKVGLENTLERLIPALPTDYIKLTDNLLEIVNPLAKMAKETDPCKVGLLKQNLAQALNRHSQLNLETLGDAKQLTYPITTQTTTQLSQQEQLQLKNLQEQYCLELISRESDILQQSLNADVTKYREGDGTRRLKRLEEYINNSKQQEVNEGVLEVGSPVCDSVLLSNRLKEMNFALHLLN